VRFRRGELVKFEYVKGFGAKGSEMKLKRMSQDVPKDI
jgi:hypothetical protein